MRIIRGRPRKEIKRHNRSVYFLDQEFDDLQTLFYRSKYKSFGEFIYNSITSFSKLKNEIQE